jgi:hypothetical protein
VEAASCARWGCRGRLASSRGGRGGEELGDEALQLSGGDAGLAGSCEGL